VSIAAVATGMLSAASVGVYATVHTALWWNIDSTLLSVARTEIASAIDEPGGPIHVHDELPVDTAGTALGYEKVAVIKNAAHEVLAQTGNVLSGSPLSTRRDLEAQALTGTLGFDTVEHQQRRFRVVYHPLQDSAGGPLVAVVALPVDALYRSLELLLAALGMSLLVGCIVATLAADRLARRLTQPLEHVATAAGVIDANNLQGRIPEVAEESEIHGLAQSLNRMLARIEEAFAAQRRFIADASHELRTPLSNLRGTLEVALRRPRLPEEYREALHIGLAESERLSTLVNDLLVLSRVDSHQLHLDLAPCDLSQVATGAVAAHAARAKESGVGLRLEVESVAVVADAGRLREVVDNLLDNALRYAPPGTEVLVRARPVSSAHAEVVVADRGPGLSEQQQRQVFDRFYRTDDSRTRDSGGLGLGLAIAKAIVEAHRGTIEVDSTLGHGCRFTVTLPRMGCVSGTQPSHGLDPNEIGANAGN